VIRKPLFLLIISPMALAADISQCGFIRETDLQSLCRAEAGGGQSQCGFIRNSDQRALCMAKAKP